MGGVRSTFHVRLALCQVANVNTEDVGKQDGGLQRNAACAALVTLVRPQGHVQHVRHLLLRQTFPSSGFLQDLLEFHHHRHLIIFTTVSVVHP